MKTKSKSQTANAGRRKPLALVVCGFLVLAFIAVMVARNLEREAEVAIEGKPAPDVSKAAPHSGGSGLLPESANADSAAADPNKLSREEELVGEILSSGRPMDQMANDLLALLPDCKGPTQKLVLTHITHLADETQFGQLLEFLDDPKISEASKEHIFTAIYEKEPEDVAALMIEVIESGNPQFALEAERTLATLLSANHGRDAAAWRAELNAQKLAKASE